MNGEDDESHYLSEYFGCSGGVGPRSPVSWLKSEGLLGYRLVGWRVPAPRSAPAGGLQLVVCGVWGASLGRDWVKSMARERQREQAGR
jgi:hypothetical protein